MRSPITLEALRTLDAIERHGSFAAAGEALHQVTSAVSYTIARLERDLDVALFDRSGHRAVLTPAGRLVLEEGRRLLEAGDRLAESARQLASGVEARLTLTVDGLLPMAAIWPLAGAFATEHPGTDLRIREEVLGGTWETLTEGEADLAIGLADRPSGPGIGTREIGEVEFVFCAAPDHPILTEPQPLAAEVVRRYRAVAVADSARRHPPSTTGLLDRQPRLTVASMRAKIAAQRRGLGVGFLPRHLILEPIAQGALVPLALAEPRPNSRLYLAWRHGDIGLGLRWFLGALDPPEALQRWL